MKISPSAARLVMALASLLGVFASAYLLYTYVSGAPIVCGAESGCELVRASKWAWTFGLPRPLFGLIFYVGVFGLLVTRAVTDWLGRWLYRLTMVAVAIGFIESAFLFFVQWLDIKAFCIWCLTSAVAAIVLVFMAFFDRYEATRSVLAERELQYYFISLAVFAPLALAGFAYLLRA